MDIMMKLADKYANYVILAVRNVLELQIINALHAITSHNILIFKKKFNYKWN